MRSLVLAAAFLLTSPAAAAWDPANGDWSKADQTDLRVMTWNVADAVCRTNLKTDAQNDWNAVVRIIAAMQPDVLILQECGDNSGNGTGSGVDSTSQLATVLELLVRGGPDPFRGGNVTSYVQKFVPGYDLPHVFVCPVTDNFNRNVILSRYPFDSINGGQALVNDFFVVADAYAPGGNGGIRGFMFAQIDLPDDVYAGDVVVGNAHLKSGFDSSDAADRLTAAKNTAYYIDYYYNGAGTGVSDPNSKVIIPSTGDVLDENTPVIWGGDFNQQPGGAGPVEWMTRAQAAGGTDGTDRDRSDSSWDMASHPVTNETSTQGSSSKLDYLCWQDSIAQARRSFIFRSIGFGMTTSNQPFPVSTYPGNPLLASTIASDHRPVLVDFVLPPADTNPGCSIADLAEPFGVLNFFDLSAYLALFNNADPSADLAAPFGTLNFFDLSAYLSLFNAGCP